MKHESSAITNLNKWICFLLENITNYPKSIKQMNKSTVIAKEIVTQQVLSPATSKRILIIPNCKSWSQPSLLYLQF